MTQLEKPTEAREILLKSNSPPPKLFEIYLFKCSPSDFIREFYHLQLQNRKEFEKSPSKRQKRDIDKRQIQREEMIVFMILKRKHLVFAYHF
ncbi:MAG TPA: hypothetical protein DEA63_03780 [Firmicutes bacterium]|nr:hypothetical protein [Bacillota bacterium]